MLLLLTGVRFERYHDEYSSSVMFGSVFAKSIVIVLSRSFHSAFDAASISSNVASPTSVSAFWHACSSDTKDIPTLIVISSGSPAYEKSAPDWYTSPIRSTERLRLVCPRPFASPQ